MKLRMWSESGGEKVSGVDPGPAGHAAVLATVAATDWADPDITGVTLESATGWADGSGSMDPGTGLSIMMEQHGVQHVGVRPPSSPDEIARFLGAYLAGDLRQVFEMLYERAPTDAELSNFVDPAPPSSPRGFAKAAFGLFLVVILGVLLALYTAR